MVQCCTLLNIFGASYLLYIFGALYLVLGLFLTQASPSLELCASERVLYVASCCLYTYFDLAKILFGTLASLLPLPILSDLNRERRFHRHQDKEAVKSEGYCFPRLRIRQRRSHPCFLKRSPAGEICEWTPQQGRDDILHDGAEKGQCKGDRQDIAARLCHTCVGQPGRWRF